MAFEVPWYVYLVVAWTLFWDALGLWKSARKGHLVWFILIVFLNTFGILPMIYVILSWIENGKARNRSKVSVVKGKSPRKKVSKKRK